MNNGVVYAVFDYAKENADEVDLNIGDKFTILKKGDEFEKEWWWARNDEKQTQGYIPRNLLGVIYVQLLLLPWLHCIESDNLKHDL